HAAARQVFPDRQRAGDAEQRLGGDVGDGAEVQIAKPGIAHPLPAERGADPHRDQPADDERDDGEMDDENRVGDHPGVMFAWRITLSHFARSLFMNAAKSSGALPTGTCPSASRRSRTSGSAMAFSTSSRRRWIAACGVRAGTTMPYQLS